MLFAIVNANYEFIYVYTGTNGRVSDGGIWHETSIYKRLMSNTLRIPSPTQLPGTNDVVPYVFLGDEAYPLMENLMKPYSQKQISHDEKIFNYRLCRARRVVENAFGILATRFTIFHTAISLNVENIDIVILASCALHNFLRRNSKTNYLASVDREDVDNGTILPGEWRKNDNLVSLERFKATKSNVSAKLIRNKYKEFYNGVGKVPFQERQI